VYNRNVITTVLLTKEAEKQLQKCPRHVAVKLQAWLESVENDGLEETKKIPGFHDEPLKDRLKGQRSIRLSRAYRAIYTLKTTAAAKFVRIVKVTKHEY